MKKRILITTPFPTPEEVADEVGVSRKRLGALRALVLGKSSAKKHGKAEDCRPCYKREGKDQEAYPQLEKQLT